MLKIYFLIFFFLLSLSLFSDEVIYSYRGIEHRTIKKNVVQIKNELDSDVIAQVWENNSLKETLKVPRSSNKVFNLKSISNVFFMGIKPPSKKIVIRK